MKNLIRYALPIYALFSLSSMAGMNIGFLILFAGLVAAVFLKKNVPLQNTPAALVDAYSRYRFWAWILFAACVISLLCAQLFPFAYAGHIPDITWHGYQKIWYMICPAIILFQFRYSLAFDTVAGPEMFEKTLNVWWSTILALLIMAIIQFFTGWPFKVQIPMDAPYYHAILLMGHHLSVSSIVIFPTFTALAIALGAYSRNKTVRHFELYAGCAGLIILFLSWARTSWLAIPIGVVFLLGRFLKPKKFIAALLTFSFLFGALALSPIVRNRIQNNAGILDRIRLWEANIDYFKHRPLTGIGWLKTQEMSEFYFKELSPTGYHGYFWGHAHSNFFEMLGGTGLIGLLAFLGWSFFTLSLAYKTSVRAREAGLERWADFSWGIFVALLLLHFNGLTNVTFWEGKVMHQQMLAVGMLLILQLWVPKKG